MPHDLTLHHCLIAIFTLEGCGHCEAYVPLVEAEVARLQRARRPIEMLRADRPPGEAAVLVAVYDLTKGDHTVQAFADRYQIETTPTTLVLPHGAGAFKVASALTPSQITHVLEDALRRAGA